MGRGRGRKYRVHKGENKINWTRSLHFNYTQLRSARYGVQSTLLVINLPYGVRNYVFVLPPLPSPSILTNSLKVHFKLFNDSTIYDSDS
jgi:hypothetical protein